MGKVVWDDEKSRKLLSILSEQKAKGKSKFSWPYIVTLFNAQSGDPQHHDRKTLYNHYSDSKDKFKCWEELQGLTGIACDPTTGIVDVQEQSLERWDAFLEKHKKHGMSIAKNGLPNLALRRSLEPPPESSTPRQPNRIEGENGADYIHRLLNETPMRCKEQLRLNKDIFVKLVNLMVERNLLSDSKYITVAEQVGICLYILAKGDSYRDAGDTFKHSISTISKYFKKALDALVILSFDIIRPHRDLSEIPPKVADGSRYWPYFKDAVGALDGTHIQANINDEESVPFRDHHGNKTWNVLACCSFDRIFTFINVGWEGSAHDVKVWKDSLTDSKYDFPHPPEGKYYLVDLGYPNTLGYLSPIRDVGIRYHMPEFRRGRPRGMEEHYNHLHSSLRMKVEMSFGQLKKRWKVFYNMPQMSKKYQMSIIVSTFTLHNFIKLCMLGIPIIQHDPNVNGMVDTNMFNIHRKNAMLAVRNGIAQQIWQSRLAENEERGENEDGDDDEVEEDD